MGWRKYTPGGGDFDTPGGGDFDPGTRVAESHVSTYDYFSLISNLIIYRTKQNG